MSDITEALLEIHYHRAIVDSFAAVFGARFLRMLKPSAQQEAWVGFDQGWVYTSIPSEDLYQALSSTIAVGGQQVEAFHLGYFPQFKVVQILQRRSHLAPSTFVAPYLRSELSVISNPVTGLSQHETLRRLTAIEGAMVYYACPLLFEIDRIYLVSFTRFSYRIRPIYLLRWRCSALAPSALLTFSTKLNSHPQLLPPPQSFRERLSKL